MKKKDRIYMDFGATTPIDSQVQKEMFKTFAFFGNASSLHSEGREAKDILESSRNKISKILNSQPQEIMFTSGGTESNNMALIGVYKTIKNLNVNKPAHIISSTIEHSSVLEVCKALENLGVNITYIKPNTQGIIDPKEIRKALRKETMLVTIMFANNEIGTIQPIYDIAKEVRHARSLGTNIFGSEYPIFHTDACQAIGYVDINTQKLGADLISLDSGKIYGPKGVGLLFKKRHITLEPIMYGGGQENTLRSGTENIFLTQGFTVALELNERIKNKEVVRLKKLQQYFFDELKKIPALTINGSETERLPNNINVCIPGLDAEFAVFQFDERGIAISSASTCMNNKEDSYSYVVKEINPGCETSSLRFTLGRTTTKAYITKVLKYLKEILNKRM